MTRIEVINGVKKLFPKSVKHFVKMQLHRGNAYECPFCHFKSKGFDLVGIDVPVLREKNVIGGGPRKSACYRCNSDDRERLVYLFLKDRLEIFEQSELRILHIAPEDNLTKILSKNFEHYTCGDLLNGSQKYPEYVRKMDITDLPFEPNAFDLVICNHVLEHVQDDRKAMKEIANVLTDDGIAILQVPISANSNETIEDLSITDPLERTTRFGQPDHVRLYGQDYVSRLEDSGFSVERISVASDYPKYGLNPFEDLFVCKPKRK